MNTRNQAVDIIRGIAMLMVVLGHTITGCTANSDETMIYNAIWTLQMPLFMLVSGYVTKYSKLLSTFGAFSKTIWKKTIAYLLPWAIWTFIVCGLLWGETSYLTVKHVLYNMDSGYWFLFTLWTIVILFTFSQFLSQYFCQKHNKYIKLIVFTLIYLFCMIMLATIGMVKGMSFLNIKLSLYYMLFYYAGYIFGYLGDKLLEKDFCKIAKNIIIAICFVIWITLLKHNNFFSSNDDISGILLRMIASLLGCVSVVGLITKINFSDLKWGGVLSYIGTHSLEIYLIHYFFLVMIEPEILQRLETLGGFIFTVINFVLCICFTCGLTILINKNTFLSFWLFGKRLHNLTRPNSKLKKS